MECSSGDSGRKTTILTKRYGIHVVWILVFLVLGVSIALLANDTTPIIYRDVTAIDIFFHNTLIAAVCILSGLAVSRFFMALSSFILGYMLIVSIRVAGWWVTVQLIVPHAPLEICAWVLTMYLSATLSPAIRSRMWTKQSAIESNFSTYYKHIARMVFLYAIAATSEHIEYSLVWR